ncbi:MAG TPA: chromosomal replication initiator protein DnaA [Rhizomicrobium sp.]|jgi:chromosomal replication initiator protein|nr:chromosomal replication initiator protein DnaA [Rhizomicrobium sp.]
MAQTTSRDIDRKTMWASARERLRRELGDPVFDAWIGALELLSMEKGDVKIGAPKSFVRNWVANHYTARIERALRAEGSDPRSVSIVLAPPSIGASLEAIAPRHSSNVAVEFPQGNAEPRRTLWNRVLHPTQTFETLVVGSANEFACQVARRFADGDENTASLLYLHGGFGYGKSHILNATALESRKRGRRVLFLGAEDFMRQFLGALHRRETLSFKDEVRAAELLLIDDLQHICRSTSTISEFLHTVNAFSDLRRRVVIAADRAPEGFDSLGPDIRSRLTGGLVIALAQPDRDMRLAILKSRAQEFASQRPHVTIPDNVLERIADIEEASPRELIGMFTKIATYADLTKKPVTMEFAEDTIHQRGAPPKKTGIEDIQRKTAEFYKLDLRDLHSKERSRRVARPRQVAMYLSRELTMRSLPEIGRRFGDRDHTTVLHACRRIVELCSTDAVLKQEVDFLKQVLSKPRSV